MVELKESALDNEVDREFNRRTLQLDREVTDLRKLVSDVSASTSRVEAWSIRADKRIDGLAAGLENVHKRFGKVDQALKEIRYGQLQTVNRVDRVQEDVIAMRAVQERHGTVLEEHGQRLDSIDGRLDGIDGRLDGIDGRFDRMDDRFVGMDDRFDRMDDRFDRMDDRFVGIDGRFDGIDGKLDRLIDVVGAGGEAN